MRCYAHASHALLLAIKRNSNRERLLPRNYVNFANSTRANTWNTWNTWNNIQSQGQKKILEGQHRSRRTRTFDYSNTDLLNLFLFEFLRKKFNRDNTTTDTVKNNREAYSERISTMTNHEKWFSEFQNGFFDFLMN